jgi:Cof subfamily protein (haloacid dehalogenase superfamily)
VPLPYRLCAIDLDDTLLGPDHQISARNARAVHAVVERGVIVVIASGRMHETTLRFADQLALDTPIISYNGAMVRRPHTDDVWLQERIPAGPAQVVADYSQEHDLQLNYYLNDHLYTFAYTPWMRLYQERTLAPVEVRADFYDLVRGKEPTKLIIVDSPEVTNGLLPVFRDLFGDRLYVTKSNDEYLEFMPPHANKGAALALVAARYGVTAAETVAFGDSWNDVPMLKWAGLGIAVGNAKPAAIAAADRTVLPNDRDGVAIALEEIFGL